ncbi:WD40 repeat domain-containing protein [Methylocapsa sp. S129]|uniref:WD40 repeat domain-containing protein n=1 Tax=Methylocapsa sp. S129 TaxID=1641869 RepID=UPI00131D629A|nr:WD40 repeat domain-containing protein [Methylocapsa sp. S129]
MTEPTSSLTKNVQFFDAGAHVTAVGFLDEAPVFALGDGVAVLGEPGSANRIAAHPGGAILSAVSDGKLLVTGGDDGRVVATSADGAMREIAHEKGRWIDALAMRAGNVAWGAGREVRVRDSAGAVKAYSAPTTVRGLCFMPKGYRLALSHYNGVSLWFPNAAASPSLLEWKGSHLDVVASPDGRFVVSSMQENSLHGWRISDARNMRMSGYPKKSRSLSWSHDGHWLATSGADACIVWPFRDKDGPMGKAPRECGVRAAKVSQVAFHPRTLVVAVGYEDGFILLCRLGDAAEILVREPRVGDGAVTALIWDAIGARLAFGLDSGGAGLLTLPA